MSEHTLEVTVDDQNTRDLDRGHGQLRIGIAPTANTLGGHDERSGNASGGSVGLLMLLALGLLAAGSLTQGSRQRKDY